MPRAADRARVPTRTFGTWQFILPNTQRVRVAPALVHRATCLCDCSGLTIPLLVAPGVDEQQHLDEMKQTKFLWQWEQYAPQPDPLMTRERAAKLLCAWRRGSRRVQPILKIKRMRVDNTRQYLIEHQETGERGGLFICKDPSAAVPTVLMTVAAAQATAFGQTLPAHA